MWKEPLKLNNRVIVPVMIQNRIFSYVQINK